MGDCQSEHDWHRPTDGVTMCRLCGVDANELILGLRADRGERPMTRPHFDRLDELFEGSYGDFSEFREVAVDLWPSIRDYVKELEAENETLNSYGGTAEIENQIALRRQAEAHVKEQDERIERLREALEEINEIDGGTEPLPPIAMHMKNIAISALSEPAVEASGPCCDAHNEAPDYIGNCTNRGPLPDGPAEGDERRSTS